MITVNDQEIDWHQGMTVADALQAMGYDFPLITVTVNSTFVPAEDHDSYEIPDGAQVKAIHLHHGG